MKKYYALLLVTVLLSGLAILQSFFLVQAEPQAPNTLDLLVVGAVPQRKSIELAKLNLEDHNLAHIGAQSFYVMDVESGAILAEKNSTQPLHPASTTKMMTAILSRELYSLNEEILVDESIKTGGNGMGLILGETMSVENLLYGLLIPSGNDSAYLLASNYEGGIDGFIEKMNEKASEMGLKDTKFQNPAGFDHQNQISTARDLAILAHELIKDDYLAEIVSLPVHQITDVYGNNPRVLKNTNYLLGKIEGVKGIKTGTTYLAGEVLVTLVERNGHQIIITLLASKDRFTETQNIINWIFDNYEWIEI